MRRKWNVTKLQMILIISTFAIGGSLCGYTGRKILGFLQMEKGAGWIITYLIVVTILWPFFVLAVSIPLGQFSFFKNYLRRILMKLRPGANRKFAPKIINVAILASGTGSNAEKIIQYFSNNSNVKIAVIVTNNTAAGVLHVAKKNAVPAEVISVKKEDAAVYLKILQQYAIDFVILAGYLKMVPAGVIKQFPGKIINIHPALLPAYGGSGMYGMKVHKAVIEANEKESGISIHFVDEIYDNGEIICQKRIPVLPEDTAESLANKIHILEHEWYPQTAANVINKTF